MAESDDPQPMSLVHAEILETLQWCLRFHTKLDEAEAARDLAVIHYMPLTISIAQSLHSLMEYQPIGYWPPGTQDKVFQVLVSVADSPLPPTTG